MQANKLINSLTPSAHQASVPLAAPRELKKGEVLVGIDEPLVSTYLVGNGVLRVARRTKLGLETTGYIQANEWLTSGFEGDPLISEIHVSAACPSLVYVVPFEIGQQALASSPLAALTGLELCLERHDRQYSQIYMASGRVSPRRALAMAMVNLAHVRNGKPSFIERSISQDMLADYINISRGMVNRLLTEFKDAGLVERTDLGLELREGLLHLARPGDKAKSGAGDLVGLKQAA